MPSSKVRLSFRRRDGTVVSFKAKKKRSRPTTRAQLEKRLSKLRSPKMRARARKVWQMYQGTCGEASQ